MPAGFVVDASVVVEFLAPGRFGPQADRVVGGLAWREPLQLFAPEVFLLEVANALRKLALAKRISNGAADRAVSRLPHLAIGTFAVGVLLDQAWSLRTRMTVYDGTYAALSKAIDRPFVSADRRLVRACTVSGIEAFTLDQKELTLLLDSLEN